MKRKCPKKAYLKSQKKKKIWWSILLPVLPARPSFTLLYHVFCEHTGSVSGLALPKILCHLWTGKKAGWACAYTDWCGTGATSRWWLTMGGWACSCFFFSALKHQFFLCFQDECSPDDRKLSKVLAWWEVVTFQARLAMPVIYTEEIFRSLRTEQIIRGEKGLMGCRNGPTSSFDRQTRIPAPWKIYKHCLPGLQKNWGNFDEMLNSAEGDW